MNSKPRIKHVSEKLNKRQQSALQDAQAGNYYPIITCCMECHKAEDKAHKATEMGVPGWGMATANHYREIRQYLESFLDNASIYEAYEQLVANRG